MLVPVILGADKTTVSVATGHQEFHPVYLSLGNLHNNMRRAHGDAVLPIAFLSIPKSTYVSHYFRFETNPLHNQRVGSMRTTRTGKYFVNNSITRLLHAF